MDATGNFDYTALNPITEAENALAKPQAEKTLSAVRDHIGEIDELISSVLSSRILQAPPQGSAVFLSEYPLFH